MHSNAPLHITKDTYVLLFDRTIYIFFTTSQMST